MNITRCMLAAIALLVSTPSCEGEEMTVGTAPAVDSKSSGIEAGRVWTGYVENYRFASGSDRVSIAFTSPTTGTVTLGTPPAGAEALDPEVPPWPYRDIGYREAVSHDVAFHIEVAERRKHAERAAFTLRDGSFDGVRLRFSIDFLEHVNAWCSLQSPYALEGGNHRCIPAGALEQSTDGSCVVVAADQTRTSVHCGKVFLCSTVACTCNASACQGSRGDLLRFDMRVNGSEAEGSSDLGRIFLEKQ